MKWSVLLAALALGGRCTAEKPKPAQATTTAAPAPPAGGKPGQGPSRASLIDMLPRCDVEHEGLFVDLGTSAADVRRDHAVGPFPDVDVAERAGGAFARVRTKRLAYDFETVELAKGVQVSLRAVARASRVVTVYVDEHRLAALQLPREDPKIIATPPIDELAVGPHTVTLRFSGVAEGPDDAYAEVDWLRIGPPVTPPESYAPPTARDIVTDVVLGGDARRALVLRSPSAVRCPVRVRPGARLETSVGYWGTGRGTAVARLLEDGEAPVVLGEQAVQGGTGATWTSMSLDLSAYAGRVIAVELRTVDATGAGRVAFGEPTIATTANGAEPPSIGAGRGVVVIVGAGLDRRTIPPWGPATDLPGLGRLVHDGVAFDRYRAPTTVVGAVLASLLTGLSPTAHGLRDRESRLDEDTRLLGERAREGSVRASMFTGVPMSFPAFGFDRGWDRFEAFSPVKDVAATEPLARAATWIREQLASGRDERWLAVVHLRGEHPPWDVTREELALLPPEEYAGTIEPRGGAIALRNLRAGGRAPVDQRLSADDWRRLHALENAALRKEDASLKRLLEVLDGAGAYADSMVVFMGDVATGDPPGIPFAPNPPLREDFLLAPLIVKFPRGLGAGTQPSSMATTVDVTATVLRALGLDLGGVQGVDLARVASGSAGSGGNALISTLGYEYSTRWGPWRLSGVLGKKPSLCLIEVDPACATDAYATSPVAGAGLWRKTYDAELAGRLLRQGRPATLRAEPDAETEAALRVFGY